MEKKHPTHPDEPKKPEPEKHPVVAPLDDPAPPDEGEDPPGDGIENPPKPPGNP
jgi:hypothetical protein